MMGDFGNVRVLDYVKHIRSVEVFTVRKRFREKWTVTKVKKVEKDLAKASFTGEFHDPCKVLRPVKMARVKDSEQWKY